MMLRYVCPADLGFQHFAVDDAQGRNGSHPR
jgi:hypothetical protein